MPEEQNGILTLQRWEQGRASWRLDWEYQGRKDGKSGDAVLRVLDESLRGLNQTEAPGGFKINVLFTLKFPNLIRIWPVDPAFTERAAQKAEQERAPAAAIEAGRKAKLGIPFAQPVPRTGAITAGHFHNPYNFIPAPEGQFEAEHPLAHRAPVGHHACHTDHFSGTIEVTLTVATPLIVSDTAHGTVENKHLTVGPLTDKFDKPILPVTSFKGVLRAAYEAITLSRMGILGKHAGKLGRRMGAGEGLAMVPARIAADGRSLELWMGSQTPRNAAEWMGKCPQANHKPPGNLMYAAWLHSYKAGSAAASPARICYAGGGVPDHGDQVVCWLRKVQKGNFFTYWRVEQIARGDNPALLLPVAPATLTSVAHTYVPGVPPLQGVGYVCKTGQNFSKKHDERVFFTPLAPSPYIEPGSPDRFKARAQDWKRLIADYRELADVARKYRKGSPDDAYRGNKPGQTAFSRHIYAPDAPDLAAGSLCYALVDAGGKVAGLYPVMIARELGACAPIDLVPEIARPATDFARLSPADRVFGWVGQAGADKANRNMHKGQLRIATLDYAGHPQNKPIQTFAGAGLPLAILSAPKPQQARFYLAADKAGTPQANGLAREKSFYTQEKSIRGRKVYPHHLRTTVVPSYWDGPAAIQNQAAQLPFAGNTYYREYIRLGNIQRDQQNRSITGWVNPGTTFTARIEVTNLSKAELGALVWLLTLPDGHFLRMGFGKPLGFGSVRAEISSVDLRDGAAIAGDYACLLSRSAQGARMATVGSLQDAKNTFQHALAAGFAGNPAFRDIAVVKAFLAASAGASNGSPVHYPRAGVAPDPAGENFQWFAANEKTGANVLRRQYALDPLWEPSGLPGLHGG